MMRKDFCGWVNYKARLNDATALLNFNEYDIWWCAIGVNVGDEEDGKNAMYERPVLILKKFNKRLFYGVPLTTHLHEGRFYHPVTSGDRNASAILSQMRAYDSRRLLRRIGRIPNNSGAKIKRRIYELLL